MAKRDWSILKGILITYGIWLLFKAFRRPRQVPGIHGLPKFNREFKFYCTSSGVKKFEKELDALDKRHQVAVQKLFYKASLYPDMKGNWVTIFKNDIITGELISGQIRVLFYQINEIEFIALCVFLKKDNATDSSEKEKARRRIHEMCI